MREAILDVLCSHKFLFISIFMFSISYFVMAVISTG